MLKIRLLRDLNNVTADGLGRPESMLNGKRGDILEVTEHIGGFILFSKWGTTDLSGGDESRKTEPAANDKQPGDVTVTHVGAGVNELENPILSEDTDPAVPTGENTSKKSSNSPSGDAPENSDAWTLDPEAIKFLTGLTKTLMEKVGYLYGVKIARTQTLPEVRNQMIDAVRAGVPKKLLNAEFLHKDLIAFYETYFNIVLDVADYTGKEIKILTDDMADILNYAFAFDA